MLYAMLIYQAEGALDHYTEAERKVLVEGHQALQADTRRAGSFLSAVQLAKAYSASVVRRTESGVTVEDGPFVEAKELVGLYLFECPDYDTAVEYAARIPHAGIGAIEVRPVAYAAAGDVPISEESFSTEASCSTVESPGA